MLRVIVEELLQKEQSVRNETIRYSCRPERARPVDAAVFYRKCSSQRSDEADCHWKEDVVE